MFERQPANADQYGPVLEIMNVDGTDAVVAKQDEYRLLEGLAEIQTMISS